MHNSLIEDKYTVQYLPCNNNKTTTSSSCFRKGTIFSDIAIRTESINPNCKSINNQTDIVNKTRNLSHSCNDIEIDGT